MAANFGNQIIQDLWEKVPCSRCGGGGAPEYNEVKKRREMRGGVGKTWVQSPRNTSNKFTLIPRDLKRAKTQFNEVDTLPE